MPEPIEPKTKKHSTRLSRFLRILGPGLVTGAADDDPSGIATYSQTGARFGLGMLWTALYQLPLIIAVQEACARISAVTGKGLAGVVKENYSKRILFCVVILVVIANTINIGADLGAMAEALRLVIHVPFMLAAVVFALIMVLLEIFISYKTYAKVLKWLALALLAYPLTALIITEPWGQIIKASLIPHLEFNFGYLFIITGVFGTTITPYMFFWQGSQEVEEEIAHHKLSKNNSATPKGLVKIIRNIKIDTTLGMIASEIAQWFIIITTATVLFSHGINNINSASDAAQALEPLVKSFSNSGQIAKDLFAVGIIGLGLLGVPVLAGSAAYAMSEAFGWKEGLYRKFSKAKGFYGVIIVSTLIGLLLNFTGIDPFKALVFTAVFNGVAAVPLLYLIGKINSNTNILGEYKGSKLSRTLIWITFSIMLLAALAMLGTLFSN